MAMMLTLSALEKLIFGCVSRGNEAVFLPPPYEKGINELNTMLWACQLRVSCVLLKCCTCARKSGLAPSPWMVPGLNNDRMGLQVCVEVLYLV